MHAQSVGLKDTGNPAGVAKPLVGERRRTADMAIAESFLRSSFVGLVAGWFQIIPPQSNSVLELGFAPRRADGHVGGPNKAMSSSRSDSPETSAGATAAMQVVVLDADVHTSLAVARMLDHAGYTCHCERNPAEACARARSVLASVVITDVGSLHRGVVEFLAEIRTAAPNAAIVLVGADVTAANALRWLRAGAADIVLKPFLEHELLDVIFQAASRSALALRSRTSARPTSDALSVVIGSSEKLRLALELARSASSVRSTVLIQGETGTGKSTLARAIHASSPRSAMPFVELACGSIPESLLESELFGHVKGAFTGAHADKKGRFLAANGGTIFLDEINSASPVMQLKLLRVLQEKRFEPVGSDETIAVDVRVIVASNQPLERLVEQGIFRQDLFYRVHVLPINLPPLRDRPDDVIALATHFLAAKSAEINRTILGFTPAAIAVLNSYSWPGNVRELENAIERATIVCDGARIDSNHLPERLADARPSRANDFESHEVDQCSIPIRSANLETSESMRSLSNMLRDPERAAILLALEASNWNRSKAAQALGINRTTLYRKMRDLGLRAYGDVG